jgi:hypothetical protein
MERNPIVKNYKLGNLGSKVRPDCNDGVLWAVAGGSIAAAAAIILMVIESD